VPVSPTFPGIYIEEIPSGVHPITGVATSIAAFVDFFPRGAMNTAVQVFSFGDFEREFGGLDDRSEASYAIQQFFLNGGTQAWVVRAAGTAATTLNGALNNSDTSITVADTSAFAPSGSLVIESEIVLYNGKNATTFQNCVRGAAGSSAASHSANKPVTQGPTKATVIVKDGVGGGAANALTLTAISEGTWGNNLRATVDYGTNAANRFNLTISEVAVASGRPTVLRQEQYLELSMNPLSPQFVATIVNSASALVTVEASGSNLPAASGTVSGATPAFPVGVPLKVNIAFVPNADGSGTAVNANDVDLGSTPINTLDDAAARLEGAIRSAQALNPAFSQARVRAVAGRLQVIAGPSNPGGQFTFTNGTGSSAAADLKLRTPTDSAVVNVAAYALGTALSGAGEGSATPGEDGIAPGATELIGTNAVQPPTGMFALDKADLFNILMLPRVAKVTGTNAFPTSGVTTALSSAITYCDNRRAFLIVDTPSNVTNVVQFKQWLSGTLDSLRDKNAAVYFPRIVSADPLNGFRARSFGASGTMAGIYARTDATRGVWKAPAGTEASLRNVQYVEYKLSDAENGVLNPLGINCLRTFDVYGNISWGARTLDGADARTSEWKYVPVRRFALFLEESLYRDTKWVVFEPNDEPLWAQIRLNISAFMHNLFRQGAFQGTTPREAYLVKCDKETTTQTDIDNGVVNILVGFAPLKPAEFVIIKIQQLAGQIET
jgi:Bacteriophage tail sheath protein